MSLAQSLHFELSTPASETPPIVASAAQQTRPELTSSSKTSVAVQTDEPPAPDSGQQVFESASLTVINKPRRLAVTALIILANLVQMTVNFSGIAGGSKLTESMGVKDSYASWIGASYALTQGTFVLMSGRLGDVFGHRRLLILGGIWLAVCTLISAFCNNFFAFVCMRALSGVGGAAIMPNAVAMIATTNPPGKVRNLSLGLFGASAPMGGYFGALFLGAFLEKTEWKWFFVFIACLNATIFVPLWALTPKEVAVDRHGKIDWIGSALGTGSLILFNFVWNQAPSVGWQTPYEIALLIISILLFAGFLIWERNFTPHPIMPLDIFKAPCFLTLLFVVLLNYMAVGTLIWYQVLWLLEVWNWSPLEFAVGWTPFVICATGAACLAAWLIPRLAAQWILAIGTITILVSNVLMATVPLRQTYWAQVFPSVVLFSFCPDLVYTAGQIIASNSVRRNQQGIAGSIIGTLNLYGNSLGLGFASTIETQIAKTAGRIWGYRAALYFGVGISVVALVLDVFFVRMVKDEREGWQGDDAHLVDVDGLELSGQAAGTTGAEIPGVLERG
ncbi:MFS general substrate transporter [Aspergillus affinis]|uniref:MFS general substrate transporter n=1 Tax=Aspergillus affinis TaxID=1070780 RepID=UPI0022FED1A9|nr:MFS general substrate transporter [Aspergillus affinis]KAI9036820.1 MFS general substrate transporter [Aspergillus affinis]